jgi:hypothetical protein
VCEICAYSIFANEITCAKKYLGRAKHARSQFLKLDTGILYKKGIFVQKKFLGRAVDSIYANFNADPSLAIRQHVQKNT